MPDVFYIQQLFRRDLGRQIFVRSRHAVTVTRWLRACWSFVAVRFGCRLRTTFALPAEEGFKLRLVKQQGHP